MKRTAVIALVIIILAGGAYAIFHKSNNNNPAKTSTTSSNAPKTSAPTVNNAVLTTKNDSKIGKYLADPSGKALYTYNADSNGASNCTGSCLTNWPAYIDSGSTTGLPAGVGTIKRSDNGQMQYTFNGKPLYYFASDASGQVTGDGVENFSAARPAVPSSSSTQSSSDSSSSGTSTGSSSSSGYPY